jgi:hypothetical protein
MISETLVAADRGHEFVCARGVDKSTSRGVGTSVIARTLNACVCSGAGRRPSGKPDAVRMKRSKSSTPRLSVRAVSVPYLRRNHPSLSKLRQRMVTQQKFFAPVLCDRPGCHETPPKLGRNQPSYCCPACRQAVRRVLDRERKWQFRGTFRGQQARQQEYQTARARRCTRQYDAASMTPPRPPP